MNILTLAPALAECTVSSPPLNPNPTRVVARVRGLASELQVAWALIWSPIVQVVLIPFVVKHMDISNKSLVLIGAYMYIKQNVLTTNVEFLKRNTAP